MTNENRERNDGIDRRSVLKSTGIAAGVGITGIGSASAESSPHRTRLVEIGVECDVGEQPVGDLETVATHYPAQYRPENGRVLLTPVASETVRSMLLSEDLVINGASFAAGPGSVAVLRSTPEVPVAVAGDYRPMKAVALQRGIPTPEAAVSLDDDEVEIAVGDAELEVDPGEEQSAPIATHEVPLGTADGTDEDEPTQAPTSLELVVHARNRGVVDVVVDG